nr:HycuOrf-121 hypothetical protein [Hyphantria cunea nucleopolyhedrovirus]
MGTVYCKTLIQFDNRKHVWCKTDDWSEYARKNIGISFLNVKNADSLLKWIEAFMFCTNASETQRFFDEAFEYMRKDLTRIMSPQAFANPDLIKSTYNWLSNETYETVVWCNQQTPRPIYYFDQEWFGPNLFADFDNYAELLKKLKIVFQEVQVKLKSLSNNNDHVYYNDGPTIMQVKTFLNNVANVVFITRNKKNNARREKRLKNYNAWKEFITEFMSRRRAAESKRAVPFNKNLQNQLCNSMYFQNKCEYWKLLDRYDGNNYFFKTATPAEKRSMPETSLNDFLDYVLYTQYRPFICETQMCFNWKMWSGPNKDIDSIFRGRYLHCALEDVQGGHFKFNNKIMFQRFVTTDELEISLHWLLENTETDKDGAWHWSQKTMFVQSSINYDVLDFETMGFKTGSISLPPISMATNVNQPIEFYKIILMIFTYELTHHCNVLINKLHEAKQYSEDQIKILSIWYISDESLRKKKIAGEYKYLEHKDFDRYICLRIYAQLIKCVVQHITKHDINFDCADLNNICDAILNTPNQPMNKHTEHYCNLEYSVITATGKKYNFKIKENNESSMYCSAKYEYCTIYWPTEDERNLLLKCARRLCVETLPDTMDETHLFDRNYFKLYKNDKKQVDKNIKWSNQIIEKLYTCSSTPLEKNNDLKHKLELYLTVLGHANYDYKVCNITCNAVCN